MPENLMNSDHKATNKAYRDNYDQIFSPKKSEKDGGKPNVPAIKKD